VPIDAGSSQPADGSIAVRHELPGVAGMTILGPEVFPYLVEGGAR
jgi:hypothetical protein